MRTRTESEIMEFWRKRNGRTHVMDLPTEVRLLIFEMVIASSGKIYPLIKSKCSHNQRILGNSAEERMSTHVIMGIGYCMNAMEGDHDVKFYTFTQDDEKFPATVRVSVIPREGALHPNKIHVRISGQLVPVQQWLVDMAKNSSAMRGRTPESI
ncbi:hypothetical protein BU25DRAFT_461905 [Macroventuria anomochaeta]|uniref:Uncharacterized protein n=1 Tax=Macroventuria anomochaeta TaxID=301207 RepID=A0ACB6RNK3_9PLEO|nr:uncharacterized protein BU25DRAFT_461905 [Macroventuria anomochaeta]KAF2623520.1 hypothetical protein BU25DRAFT_461905 [Macroventuria anomochaeta]